MHRVVMGKHDNSDGIEEFTIIHIVSSLTDTGYSFMNIHNPYVDSSIFQVGDILELPALSDGSVQRVSITQIDQSATGGSWTVNTGQPDEVTFIGYSIIRTSPILIDGETISQAQAENELLLKKIKTLSHTERLYTTDTGLYVSRPGANVLDPIHARTGNLAFDSSDYTLGTLKILQTGTFQIQCKKTFMGKKGGIELLSDEQNRANADYTKLYPFEVPQDADFVGNSPTNANTINLGYKEGQLPITGNAFNHEFVQNVYCDYGTTTVVFDPPLPDHIKTPYVSLHFAVANSSGHFHPWYANVTCTTGQEDYQWQYANSQHCVHMDTAWFRGKWSFRERTLAPFGTNLNNDYSKIDPKVSNVHIGGVLGQWDGSGIPTHDPALGYYHNPDTLTMRQVQTGIRPGTGPLYLHMDPVRLGSQPEVLGSTLNRSWDAIPNTRGSTQDQPGRPYDTAYFNPANKKQRWIDENQLGINLPRFVNPTMAVGYRESWQSGDGFGVWLASASWNPSYNAAIMQGEFVDTSGVELATTGHPYHIWSDSLYNPQNPWQSPEDYRNPSRYYSKNIVQAEHNSEAREWSSLYWQARGGGGFDATDLFGKSLTPHNRNFWGHKETVNTLLGITDPVLFNAPPGDPGISSLPTYSGKTYTQIGSPPDGAVKGSPIDSSKISSTGITHLRVKPPYYDPITGKPSDTIAGQGIPAQAVSRIEDNGPQSYESSLSMNSPTSVWGGAFKSFAGMQGITYFANSTHLKIDAFMTPTHTPTPFETEIVKTRVKNLDANKFDWLGNYLGDGTTPNQEFDEFGNIRKNVGISVGGGDHPPQFKTPIHVEKREVSTDKEVMTGEAQRSGAYLYLSPTQSNALYYSWSNVVFRAANAGYGLQYKEDLPRKFRTKYWDGSQTEYEWWPLGHANGHFTISYSTKTNPESYPNQPKDGNDLIIGGIGEPLANTIQARITESDNRHHNIYNEKNAARFLNNDGTKTYPAPSDGTDYLDNINDPAINAGFAPESDFFGDTREQLESQFLAESKELGFDDKDLKIFRGHPVYMAACYGDYRPIAFIGSDTDSAGGMRGINYIEDMQELNHQYGSFGILSSRAGAGADNWGSFVHGSGWMPGHPDEGTPVSDHSGVTPTMAEHLRLSSVRYPSPLGAGHGGHKGKPHYMDNAYMRTWMDINHQHNPVTTTDRDRKNHIGMSMGTTYTSQLSRSNLEDLGLEIDINSGDPILDWQNGNEEFRHDEEDEWSPFWPILNKGTRFPNQLPNTEGKGYPPNSQYEPGDAFLKTRTYQGQPTSLDSFWNSFSNNMSQFVAANTPYGEFYYADGGYAIDFSPYFNYAGGTYLYSAEKVEQRIVDGDDTYRMMKLIPTDFNIQRQSLQKHNWNGGNPKAGVGTEGKRFGFGGAGSVESLGTGDGVFDTYVGRYIIYDIEGGNVDA